MLQFRHTPLITSLVNARHDIKTSSQIQFLTLGAQVDVQYVLTAVVGSTGQPLRDIPVDVYVDGKLYGHGRLDGQGKYSAKITFKDVGVHNIQTFIATRLTQKLGIPGDKLQFILAGLTANAIDGDTNKPLDASVLVSTALNSSVVLQTNVKNLIPVPPNNNSVTVVYPTEITSPGDYGLASPTDKVFDILTGDIVETKTYMPFKMITLNNAKCAMSIGGDQGSRFTQITNSTFKALKGSMISIAYGGPEPRPKIGDIATVGIIANGKQYTTNPVQLQITDDVSVNPQCVIYVSVTDSSPGLTDWHENQSDTQAWVQRDIDLSDIDMGSALSVAFSVEYDGGSDVAYAQGSKKLFITVIDDIGQELFTKTYAYTDFTQLTQDVYGDIATGAYHTVCQCGAMKCGCNSVPTTYYGVVTPATWRFGPVVAADNVNIMPDIVKLSPSATKISIMIGGDIGAATDVIKAQGLSINYQRIAPVPL